MALFLLSLFVAFEFCCGFVQIVLFDHAFEVLVPSHEISDCFLAEFLVGFKFVDSHFQQLNLFVFFGHFVKQFEGLFAEDDELLFEDLYFFSMA